MEPIFGSRGTGCNNVCPHFRRGSSPCPRSLHHYNFYWSGRTLNFCGIYFSLSSIYMFYQCVWSGCYFLLTGSNQHNVISVMDQLMSYGRERWSGSLGLNCNLGLESWYTLRQDREGVLLALPAESKLLLVVFIIRDGEKSTFQTNGCIPGTRRCVHLLKQWSNIWVGSAATTGVTTWLSLW